MPIKKSALKALKQSKKRAERNKQHKLNINWLKRQFLKAVDNKNKKDLAGIYLKIQKALDKALQKGVLKKNTVARTKSRLMKKINTLDK
jgi:small subunit ribosomal protein S20